VFLKAKSGDLALPISCRMLGLVRILDSWFSTFGQRSTVGADVTIAPNVGLFIQQVPVGCLHCAEHCSRLQDLSVKETAGFPTFACVSVCS
jgi:hypothetical protein